MPNLLNNISDHKKTVILLGAYLLVLISIPLSFSLVQSSQIFKSRASETKAKVTQIQSTKASEVPKSSPLEDLKKLAQESPKNAAPSPVSSAVSFGPTLKFKVALEGRPTNNQSGKLFLGLAQGNSSIKPTYLLTFSVDLPLSGQYSGLSLAGLSSGSTYTAYLKGPAQIDKAVTFNMGPAETNLNARQTITLISGDLNEDNTVTDTDSTIVSGLIGTTTKSVNWNPAADFNGDGTINSFDLAYVTKNKGKVGDSGIWISPPPEASPAALLRTGSPSAVGGYWLYFPPIE